jgi:hypothetical protein
MIRIRVTAALKVGSEAMRPVKHAGVIRISQPSLPALGTIEPAQHVIERAVLHHQHDVCSIPDAPGAGSPPCAKTR